MYKGTLIAVTSMDESKKFYHDILGMNVVADFGANVQLDNGLFLQTIDTWSTFIRHKAVCLQNNASELYFEESDMDSFLEKLKKARIEYVQEPLEHSWGQKAVRFYDPDHHIIEVAEDIIMVVKRFYRSGLSEAEIAARMDVPIDYIKERMKLEVVEEVE